MSATLVGSLSERLGTSHGKQRTKTFALGPVRASLLGGVAKTLVVNLPAGPVSALGHGTKESATFTLSITGPSGTHRTTAAIPSIRL